MKTKWILVECISQYRTRYVVEVPEDHPEYALDTVTMEQAKEFSQEHLGEVIVSHRPTSLKVALKMFDKDNPEFSDWSVDLKLANYFTPWEEQRNEKEVDTQGD